MDSIIKGTTPTIKWKFSTVDVANIAAAYFVMKSDEHSIEKTLASAAIADNALSWTLTQQETLAMEQHDYILLLDWKLADETRGTGKPALIRILPAVKNEVI